MDARHWFVEGAMGLVIALVFAIVYLAGDRDPGLLHYVDPILVLGVVWLSVRSPWGLARQGWFEMLERSGDRRLQQRIRKLLDRPIRLIPHDSEVLRVGRFGRITYIQLYLIVSPQNELTRHVLAHDRIRQLMYDHLYKTFHDAFALEVIITSDRAAGPNTPSVSIKVPPKSLGDVGNSLLQLRQRSVNVRQIASLRLTRPPAIVD